MAKRKQSKNPRARKRAASTRAAAGTRAAAAGAGVQSKFELENEAVETALQTGEHAGLLEDYFGPEQYAELRQLSRDAAARGVRGGPRVLILPGIMGSTIGTRRPSIFDDVIWLDPIDVARGRLAQLALPGSPALEALGVILFTYLKLKLRLRAAGYDADFHPFDWRLSIAESGKALKARIEREGGDRVSLVAHSMGGLVARWALNHGAACRRLIMLGTPNFGSFAPVQALRATYPVVRKVAFLDPKHTPEALSRDVFSSFDGLTQMLPNAGKWSEVDLYDLENWPDDDLRPRKRILQQVPALQAALGGGAGNFILIAGVDQETTTNMRVVRESGPDGRPVKRFEYQNTTEGDGTVPLEFARLDGVKTYYIAESHGSLPNNAQVAQAVRDLLDRGETNVLPGEYTPAVRREAPAFVPEDSMRVDPFEGRRGRALSQREVRHLLEEVASPEARDEAEPAPAAAASAAAVPGTQPILPGYRHQFERVVVGRRRQHRIDLRFALGSVTEVNARAIALGLFRDVAPSGAARAVDERLDGAITEMSRRRMFSAQVGEIFMLPTGRHPIAADLIAFVGLGPFDRFTDDVLQIAAENVIRTFINARVEEFATVPIGGGSGESPAAGLRNLLTGFIRGLSDADRDHHFRRIIVCEREPQRFVQLKEELYRLSSTALCQDVEMTFDEITLPAPLVAAPTAVARARAAEDPVYLIVRQEQRTDDRTLDVRSSVLTTGAKATVISGVSRVARLELDRLCRRIADQEQADFSETGQALASLLLAPEVRHVLPSVHDHHLVVVHDAPMSRVPWETLAIPSNGGGVWFPAAEKGLVHRYEADNLSVAKWLQTRIEDGVFSVLLVVDPTRDLAGARLEGQRVLDLVRSVPGCVVDQLYQEQATRPALLAAFSSGRYDVIHYAGHAEFNEANPAQSGIVCHNGVRLTGADLAGLANLPALVFFNACESARVRKKTGAHESPATRVERVDKAVGLAEAFMRGGVANFLGTYWPVGDDAAEVFAHEFYTGVLRGNSVGSAIQAGRKAVRDLGSKDWANYTFYGAADFVIKDVAPR